MPRQKQSVVMPSRKSLTIYENWKVYSLQGKLMFRCNQKKARWYLDRELAVKRDKEEHAIQLTFEAKGQGHDENDYMIEDRKNICVVCASQAGLTLHTLYLMSIGNGFHWQSSRNRVGIYYCCAKNAMIDMNDMLLPLKSHLLWNMTCQWKEKDGLLFLSIELCERQLQLLYQQPTRCL